MAITHGHGNPNWTREETVLALELYFELNGATPDPRDARVQELSRYLRRLPYHSVASRKQSFRNPDGVGFKLQNLRKLATGKGLGNVSGMDRRVWDELGEYPGKVKELSKLIREGVKVAENGEYDDPEVDEEFEEGRTLTGIHKRRERNKKVRAKLIEQRRSLGKVECEMCGTTGTSTNLKFKEAIFEAHHIIPISMAVAGKTRLSDMMLICANCHKMLHRAISSEKRWLDLQEGKSFLGFKF
ncbi:MAG: HNH endonuclease [Elusimicrobiales bacterium]|nr:HNH endonuclease [Elusimicrobiales bacterium]